MIIDKYILYIYLIHGKYCSATEGFLKFITTFVWQLRRWNEIENRQCYKIQTKLNSGQEVKALVIAVCFVDSGTNYHRCKL